MIGKVLAKGEQTLKIRVGNEENWADVTDEAWKFAKNIMIGTEISFDQKDNKVSFVKPMTSEKRKMTEIKMEKKGEFRTRDEIIRSIALESAIEINKVYIGSNLQSVVKLCEKYIREGVLDEIKINGS